MTHSIKWVGERLTRGGAFLLVLLILVCIPLSARAKSSGTTGASFLKIPVGPRAAAMGSAYTAVTDEPYALHYNPASVGLAEDWELSAMHQTQFGEIRFDYFGISAPAFKNKSGWGISFVRQAVEDFSRTELDDGVRFINSDMALTATYGQRLFQPLTVGISGKIIRQTLAQYSAGGWAVDIGANLRVNPRVSLGAAVLHMGPKITFISVGDPLPMTFRFGTALRLLPRGNLLATIDYWYPKDDADGIGMGIEYRPNRFFAIRGGYELGTDFTGFNASSLGMTFDFDHFGIEYAFVPREKLGDVHRAGLNVTFGGKKPDVIAAKPRHPARRRQESVRRQESPPAVRPAGQTRVARSQEAPSPYIAPSAAPARKEKAEASSRPVTGRTSADMMSLRKSPVQSEPPAVEGARQDIRPATTHPASTVSGAVPPLPEEGPAVSTPAPPKAAPATADRRPYYETPIEEEEEPAVSGPKAMIKPASEKPAPAQSRDAVAQEKISLASNLMKENRYQEASVIVRSALKDDPRSVPLLYLLSECLYRLGDYDQAMDAVNSALAIIHGGGKGQ